MELIFSIFFIMLGFVLFILSIYEELTNSYSDDEEDQSDHAIIILLFLTVFTLVIGGISLMYASETYYSSVTDTIEEILLPSYRPIGYVIVFFASIPFLMMIIKILDQLGKRST